MSLKGDKYETAEEIRFRLENSVVLYQDRPVYITRVKLPEAEDRDEIARVYFRPLPLNPFKHAQETRKYLSSRHFDLAPFKMGYMNHNGKAFFISRSPIRQNRQGLGQGTTSIANFKGDPERGFGFADMISAQGFVDMVEGKYPSFKEAEELIGNKEHDNVAVSRQFAFFIDHDLESLYLLHKGVKCGLAMKNEKAVRVPPKFRFLREEMEECRIPIA